MKLTYKFDQALIQAMVAEQRREEPSGRMSASRLTWPTQWQILWKLKVPPSQEDWEVKPNKINTLHFRHFARGKQCEDWLEKTMPPMKAQEEVHYRGWVGYADRIDTGSLFGVDSAVVTEVKSVKADKWYKMFVNPGDGPQYDHVLQANFYAMGLNLPQYVVCYLRSDTMETRTYLYNVDEYRKDVDEQIDLYDQAVDSGTIPVFKAKVEYQKNPKYNMYSEYMDWTPKQLQELYNKYVLEQ